MSDDTRMDRLESKIDGIDRRLSELAGQLAVLNERLARVDKLEARLDKLEERVGGLEKYRFYLMGLSAALVLLAEAAFHHIGHPFDTHPVVESVGR